MKVIKLKDSGIPYLTFHLYDKKVDTLYLKNDFMDYTKILFRENIFEVDGILEIYLTIPEHYTDANIRLNTYCRKRIDVLIFKTVLRVSNQMVARKEHENENIRQIHINEYGIDATYSDQLLITHTEYDGIEYLTRELAGMSWIDILKYHGYEIIINGEIK